MLKQLLLAATAVSLSLSAHTQLIIDFEALPLDSLNYDFSKQADTGDYNFTAMANNSQGAYSAVFYGRNESWGGYSGFTYSNMTDDTTAAYTNDRSAITGSGYNNSEKYAVVYDNTYGIKFAKATNDLSGVRLNYVYLTNATYPALSMENGDGYAKKFGGTSGNDTDYFYVTIYGYLNGIPGDSLNFYLADYRFSDNDSDYIVKDWMKVDLSSLGNIDSLSFGYTSTDTGIYGINTPKYFCLDNLSIVQPVGITDNTKMTASVYPNPARSNIFIKYEEPVNCRIYNVNGQIVNNVFSTNNIDVHTLANGSYYLQITDIKGERTTTVPFVKQ